MKSLFIPVDFYIKKPTDDLHKIIELTIPTSFNTGGDEI